VTITTITLFSIYQIFYGLLSFYHSTSARAHPEDLAELDVKLWREDTALAAGATMLLLAIRVNGIAFLVYLGVQTEWYFPIILWLTTLVGMSVINTLVRMKLGTALPALPGFVVLPIVGVWVWFTV
jgi:hypothetical protein